MCDVQPVECASAAQTWSLSLFVLAGLCNSHVAPSRHHSPTHPIHPSSFCTDHQKLTKAAFARNLLIMGAGARESIRILPPLNVTPEEIDTCLNKLEDSMAEVLA
jgi:hypothetical protein